MTGSQTHLENIVHVVSVFQLSKSSPSFTGFSSLKLTVWNWLGAWREIIIAL